MRIGLRASSNFTALANRLALILNPSVPGPVQQGMLAASDAYHQAMRERFAQASDGDGTWAPLAPSTVKQRVSTGESEPLPILHRTGSLEESLSRGESAHVLDVTEDGVIEGTSHEVARYHQDGTDRMPARPILVPPEAGVLAAMKAPLVGGLRAAIKGDSHPMSISDSEMSALFGIEMEP